MPQDTVWFYAVSVNPSVIIESWCSGYIFGKKALYRNGNYVTLSIDKVDRHFCHSSPKICFSDQQIIIFVMTTIDDYIVLTANSKATSFTTVVLKYYYHNGDTTRSNSLILRFRKNRDVAAGERNCFKLPIIRCRRIPRCACVSVAELHAMLPLDLNYFMYEDSIDAIIALWILRLRS